MNSTEDRNAALDAISFKLESPEPQQEEVETPIDPEVQAEADVRLAEGGPSMFQQVQGLAIEGGGNIGGMYLANKYRAPAKIAKGLTFLNKIRTVGRGAALAGTAGPQAFEPVSTIGGVAAFAATEAAVGIFSNVVKQEYFKALGVQEETSGGEILASGLLISQVIKQGNKLPILGQAFDTAMLKSRKWKVGAHMVQGAVVGSVESSIRQTFDLMMNEDASISDFSMKDLMTGVAAGATMGGTLSLGSDGIKLIKTYRAVVARSKVEMRGSLVEKLAKLDASITKMQKMKQGGRRKVVTEMRYAETKKKLDELDAVHDSIDEKLAETEAALESVNTPKETPEAPEASATTATPKDTPEATPAPKTPEVAPEAAPKTPFQALMDDYDAAIAEQSQGRGADQIVTLNKHFNAISDDFAKKADALIANPDAKSVDDLLSMLDEYTAFDAKDAELKQKTGQGSRAQGRDAGDADFEREKMSPERQIRNDALKEVREKLQAMKDDVDGAEMQKLVDDIFTYPEPVKGKSTRTPSPDESFMPPPKDGEAPVETPKGETKAPKKSSRERSIDRLQKKLDELRAIRSGEKDPKNPKPKKAKSAEEKDLEERIKFYQGESKEVADIASTQERIQVLSGLIQGNSQSQIRQQIGLPPKLLPAHAKPKKIETTLTKLKAQEAKLMKILRRKQTDAILSDMRNVFDPSHESRSIVDKALNGYLMARTDALLNQPSTATTGLPSGIIQTIWRPLINTGKNTVQALNPADRALKGVPMTQRMKYAAADMLATADQLITFAQSPIVTSKQALRNTVDTFKQGGSSGYFYKDANKIDVRDDAVNAGNSSIRNTRNVIQADIRAKANEQKNVIVKQAMKLMGSDPATAMMALSKAIWSFGRSGVGALDEPFNLILQGRGIRAEAIKEAIKQKVKPDEVAGFIDDYITKSSTVDAQGVKRFNYLDDKYGNTANQTRRGLFRGAELEAKDPRILMEEHLVNSIRSWTGGDLTAAKFLFRFLQPIITTPTIALAQQGRTVARATGIPAAVDVGQRMYAGAAKRVGSDGKISNVMSGGINKQINDLEMTVEDLRAKTKEKGLDPEEQTKRDENLAANKEKLKSLRDYRDEQTYEKIAMTALGMGLFYTFFELGKNGLATGAGAFLTRDQRNQGEFQKYRLLADEDSEGANYLLAEPIRFLAAIAADLGAWSALEGSTTEKQTMGNFITSTLEAYATDSVFTTSLRHMKDLAFGKEKSRTGAVIDIAAGALPIPSGVRSARVLDDERSSVYDEGAKFSDIGSRAFDKAVGTEAENFRVDKLGRPLLRPERGALNYVFRYAPEERAYRTTAEEEVRQVLRNDGLSYNLIPKLTEFKTINGTQVNLKEFTRKDRSLFNLFAEVVNDGDEMLHELHDLVMDEDWQLDYDNYTVEPNPDNQDELYNKGIERFKEVRQKHIDRAVDYISDEANINLYRNKDGQTVHEYIESLEDRPARSGNVLEKLNQF
jgi:hypothetical protein